MCLDCAESEFMISNEGDPSPYSRTIRHRYIAQKLTNRSKVINYDVLEGSKTFYDTGCAFDVFQKR